MAQLEKFAARWQQLKPKNSDLEGNLDVSATTNFLGSNGKSNYFSSADGSRTT